MCAAEIVCETTPDEPIKKPVEGFADRGIFPIKTLELVVDRMLELRLSVVDTEGFVGISLTSPSPAVTDKVSGSVP